MTASRDPSESRCDWARGDPLLIAYHDKEWGVAVHDEHKHLELLVLEGAQSGLSWLTVLRKREGYREAFFSFDPEKVAAMADKDLDALLENTAIIRNRQKIQAARSNARALLGVAEQWPSFDAFVWSFVDNTPIRNGFSSTSQVPAHTPLSDRLSKELKKRGFSFVGPTTTYSYLQSAGLVNDHVVTCPRWKDLRD